MKAVIYFSDFFITKNKRIPHFMPTGLSECYTQVFKTHIVLYNRMII